MKYIFFLLILISSFALGQGKRVAVFDPASNSYVYLYVYETNNPPTSITNPTLTNPTLAGSISMPTGVVTNAMLSGSIAAAKLILSDINLTESQTTNLVSDLALKAPLASPTFTGTVTLPASTVTNSMLAGSIAASKLIGSDITLTESQTTNLVTDLGNKQGISVAATSATTGTMTTVMTSGTQTGFTITPTGACTFNASGGKAGARMTFVITTSGVSSFTLTWGTNFKTTATLATGTTTAKTFCVSFFCLADNITWVETARTTAM